MVILACRLWYSKAKRKKKKNALTQPLYKIKKKNETQRIVYSRWVD